MKPRNILLRCGDLPVALAKINLCEKLITTQLLEQVFDGRHRFRVNNSQLI